MKLSIPNVEAAIGIKAEDWVGRCYEIAEAIVRVGLAKGTAVYGHWLGDVVPGSRFDRGTDRSFIQHGWIALDDEVTIVDPTRWVFEGHTPYIFVGKKPDDDFLVECRNCGHIYGEHEGPGAYLDCECEDFDPKPWPYDEGGSQWREAWGRPCPEPEGERTIELPLDDVPLIIVQTLLDERERRFTFNQLFWLANLPYDAFGEHVAAVYNAITAIDQKALIPIDNRFRAQRLAEKQP